MSLHCLRRLFSQRLPGAAAAVAVVLLSSVTYSADVPQALKARLGAAPERETVDALDFMLSLSLSRDQARMILMRYEDACRLHTQAYADRADIQPREIAAYTAFLEQDRLNQGFTPEVETEAARIHHRAKTTHEKFVTDLNALSAQVAASLTADQRSLAERYVPQQAAVLARYATAKEKREAAERGRRAKSASEPGNRPVDAVRRELDALSDATHPELGPLARHLLTPAAAQPLYELAGMRVPEVVRDAVEQRAVGTRDYPRPQADADRATLQKLRTEINNWNLANGMHFSRPQIERLVALADEAERLRTTQQKAKPKDKLTPAAFGAEIVRLEQAAEAELNPGQREVLETYKPCLIPPKNLKDPVRVGQAADTSQASDWLARARGKSAEQVERLIDRALDAEKGRFGPLDEASEAERRAKLRDAAQRASAMTDVEFALSREDLAAEIRREDRKDDLVAQLDTLRRERQLPGRTAQFVLNRGFAEVLKTRYAQLAGAGAAKKE